MRLGPVLNTQTITAPAANSPATLCGECSDGPDPMVLCATCRTVEHPEAEPMAPRIMVRPRPNSSKRF